MVAKSPLRDPTQNKKTASRLRRIFFALTSACGSFLCLAESLLFRSQSMVSEIAYVISLRHLAMDKLIAAEDPVPLPAAGISSAARHFPSPGRNVRGDPSPSFALIVRLWNTLGTTVP